MAGAVLDLYYFEGEAYKLWPVKAFSEWIEASFREMENPLGEGWSSPARQCHQKQNIWGSEKPTPPATPATQRHPLQTLLWHFNSHKWLYALASMQLNKQTQLSAKEKKNQKQILHLCCSYWQIFHATCHIQTLPKKVWVSYSPESLFLLLLLVPTFQVWS